MDLSSYLIFIGIYDQKLGPIAISPMKNVKWLQEQIENPNAIIQDGLNTKAKIFVMNRDNRFFLQVQKFNIVDARFRGGQLRCCLYCIVPKKKPLFPDSFLDNLINSIISISKNRNSQMDSPEIENYLLEQEKKINNELDGSIGEGQLRYKKNELLTTIVGYAELLADGVLGPLNEEQKEAITYILKFSTELVNL